ncbi:VP6 [Callinectes sapidus reovirus 2]|uniref:VP6 n=1 Tax=Callinectes sapidus reovirus 2 TaxID=2789658 RepID=A0A7U3QER3_9REOV|nr:VP6 [Callinectes sapidus reovirus 2]
MIIVMLRQVEKAKARNAPDLNDLLYNLRQECSAKRMSFDNLKAFTSDDLITATLNPLSRIDLCKYYALMVDLLSEVTPIEHKTLKTMPLVTNDIPTPLDNVTVVHHEIGQVIETRYHKHSASFSSLSELHKLQHLDVMNDELAVYNLGVAGNMFDCMFIDDNGKTVSCSSLSNWNGGVSFCSLMPRMTSKDEVHTIVRRLAGLPTNARLCRDNDVTHVRYHVGRAITYILSKYAISSWSIGFDEIGAPTFHFNAVRDDRPIPSTCCARPKPVKEQKRIDNNMGKRHYHTWRMLGDATGNASTPVDCTVRGRKTKSSKKNTDCMPRKYRITKAITTCTAQVLQYDEIRKPSDAQLSTVTSGYAQAPTTFSLDDNAEYPPLGVQIISDAFSGMSCWSP